MKAVTLGEAMLRLSPPNFNRLEQATSFDVRVGGAELSVAAGLVRWGWEATWVSRLPDHAMGHLVRNRAREMGVNTNAIVWDKNDRVGIYFLEFGASPRPSNVIYDRAHSAISNLQPGMVDWTSVFSGVDLFHTTGITPALSDSCADVTREALKAAKSAGAKISYDLNYRGKLWTKEKARQIQEPFMQDIDILITTEEDTDVVFGIKGDTYEDVARQLTERFNFECVVITLRETPSVWKNLWSALVYKDGKAHKSREYELEIVDRLGGGDSCAAGFLASYMKDGDAAKAVEYGVAFSALHHSVPGDFNYITPAEVENLLKGGGLRIAR